MQLKLIYYESVLFNDALNTFYLWLYGVSDLLWVGLYVYFHCNEARLINYQSDLLHIKYVSRHTHLQKRETLSLSLSVCVCVCEFKCVYVLSWKASPPVTFLKKKKSPQKTSKNHNNNK